MQLPFYMKWNAARSKRRTLLLYAVAVMITAILAAWLVSGLLSALILLWKLIIDVEGRSIVLNTMKTAASTIGIAIALVGSIFLTWTIAIHRVWKMPNRYRKALDRLRDERLEHRLESISTLGRIAKLAAKEHWTITNELTTFIQERSPIYQRGKTLIKSAIHEHQAIASDIQAALTIIGRKSVWRRLVLRMISKPSNTDDTQINIGLTNLRQARLRNANLSEANLYRVNLQEANLHSANLHRANLQGADLKEINLYKANLQRSSLQGANLQKAFLPNANLREANLYRANLQWANLQGANLQKVSLQEATLRDADLQAINLQEAFLADANLQGANLYKANLRDANLYRTNLRNVEGLTDEQLSHAKLCMTILPDGTISNRDCECCYD